MAGPCGAEARNDKGTVSGAFLSMPDGRDIDVDWRELAEWTGLEPATSGVTGQHSNRLNYHSACDPLTAETCVTQVSGGTYSAADLIAVR